MAKSEKSAAAKSPGARPAASEDAAPNKTKIFIIGAVALAALIGGIVYWRSGSDATTVTTGENKDVDVAVLMAPGNVIHTADLGLRAAAPASEHLEEMSLEDVEALLIRKAMARHGNVTLAAKALGLSRSALYRRLERYKLA